MKHKLGGINTQLYAGEMANTIGQLIALKEALRVELIENGYSPEKASDAAERIYEAAWEYVNRQVIEE